LLFETEVHRWVEESWVVWCSPQQQLDRLMQRDRLDRTAAQKRIAAQIPLAEKCQRADQVLDNSAAPTIWQEQVHNRLT
jgi:dephospho-CoA kinase